MLGVLGHLLVLPGWMALVLLNLVVPFYSFHNGSAWELLSAPLSALFFAGIFFRIRQFRMKDEDLS